MKGRMTPNTNARPTCGLTMISGAEIESISDIFLHISLISSDTGIEEAFKRLILHKPIMVLAKRIIEHVNQSRGMNINNVLYNGNGRERARTVEGNRRVDFPVAVRMSAGVKSGDDGDSSADTAFPRVEGVLTVFRRTESRAGTDSACESSLCPRGA